MQVSMSSWILVIYRCHKSQEGRTCTSVPGFSLFIDVTRCHSSPQVDDGGVSVVVLGGWPWQNFRIFNVTMCSEQWVQPRGNINAIYCWNINSAALFFWELSSDLITLVNSKRKIIERNLNCCLFPPARTATQSHNERHHAIIVRSDWAPLYSCQCINVSVHNLGPSNTAHHSAQGSSATVDLWRIEEVAQTKTLKQPHLSITDER